MSALLSTSNAAAWFAQVAVIVAVAGVLPWLFRMHTPHVLHAYWRVVLGACVLLPWMQGRIETVAPAAAAPVVRLTRQGGAAASAAVQASTPTDWIAIAVWVALAGAAARLIWMFAGYLRLRRLQHAGELADGSEELDELREVIPARADVRFVGELEHPVTFGAIRPVILLPASLRGQPAEIRRAVLTHELLHVQRRDWAWLLVEEALRALLWFHPAIWWLVDRVQLSREEVVDELAVTVTGRRRAYVEALLAFADRPPLAPAPAFARRRHLFRRMVLISTEAAMSPKRIVWSCAVMALVVVSGAWYASAAFPLTSLTSPPAQSRSDVGPLERRANPVTPENPVPRRITTTEPQTPAAAEAINASGSITLYITLDDAGRVAESRPVGLSLRSSHPSLNGTFSDSGWRGTENWLSRADPRVRAAVDAMVDASIEAVRYWQYDPPFKAPLSFSVVVRFGAPPPPPPPPPVPAATARNSRRATPPPPPPPPDPVRLGEMPAEVTADGAVRVGNGIKAPTKIRDVRPFYPPIAQAARVQGIVIVEARIERDGTVSDARVLRSIPLLDQAAIDAVMQWEFVPTRLNGVPIPVIMTMTVNFVLQ